MSDEHAVFITKNPKAGEFEVKEVKEVKKMVDGHPVTVLEFYDEKPKRED